jgi:hypothetical protein
LILWQASHPAWRGVFQRVQDHEQERLYGQEHIISEVAMQSRIVICLLIQCDKLSCLVFSLSNPLSYRYNGINHHGQCLSYLTHSFMFSNFILAT